MTLLLLYLSLEVCSKQVPFSLRLASTFVGKRENLPLFNEDVKSLLMVKIAIHFSRKLTSPEC